MSTRSQIKIVDNYDELWFYRHSDGYPAGNLPQLRKFVQWMKDGKIRRNVPQASGWLIILGAQEYAYHQILEFNDVSWEESFEMATRMPLSEFEPHGGLMGWKVGAYEPCPCKELHGDVEWLYEINVDTLEIKINFGGKTVTDDPEIEPKNIVNVLFSGIIDETPEIINIINDPNSEI